MIQLTVQDAFYVVGRGYIFWVRLPVEMGEPLRVGDTIRFSEDEQYEIRGIERAKLLLSSEPFSPNVGILVRGELKYDKNTYYGKTFTKVVKE